MLTRRSVAYALLFAGVFLATVWLRSTGAPARSLASGGDRSGVQAPAAASLTRAGPQHVAATPAAVAARLPAAQPIDDPRDTIAGDIYPIVQEVGGAPNAASVRPQESPRQAPAPPTSYQPVDAEADALRDAIAGDVYPLMQQSDASSGQP